MFDCAGPIGSQQPITDTTALFWLSVRRCNPDACWPWIGAQFRDGYGRLPNTPHFQGVRVAHRFAWILTHGPIQRELYVCHHCDNPPCCNPAHLFAGTPQQNYDDMRAKGRLRRAHGQHCRSARLTPADVFQIRADTAAGVSFLALAARFGVTRIAIAKVAHRKSWAWL